MKLISFEVAGQPSYGVVEGGGIVDVGREFGARWPSLRHVLAAEGLAELGRAVQGRSADHALGDVTFLPPIPDPAKIICVGMNYEPHRIEMGRDKDPYPTLFSRFTDCLVAHDQPIVRPRVSEKLDYEGEFALVIGRGGRYIRKANAFAHIAGYACFLDGSLRDYQVHTGQVIAGKNFPRTGGFGPWMVTADEAGDPAALELTTRLNGEVMQEGRIDQLIYPIPELIAYISQWTELAPGDVISTGTPSGVGLARTPPVFMGAGDTIEVEISRIGTLRHSVIDE